MTGTVKLADTTSRREGVTATGIRTELRVPPKMKAWVLGEPGELELTDKPVPAPGVAEVLVRVDAVAICGTDLEVIAHGDPALVRGGKPFNQNFTPGHEYMGTVAALGPGVDEFAAGERVAVEIHAGCGRCERCREGMYTACLNYGMNYPGHDKGHRANGFTTDGGFAEYAVNHVNTLVRVPGGMSDEEATLIVTAGTAIYGLDVLGGLVAGQSVIVIGPGAINDAAHMVSRGGRICAVAFAKKPVLVDVARLVSNNIYLFGIRGEGRSATRRAAALMAQKRFSAKLIHTHTFPFVEVPTAIRYAADRVEDAIKVVVKM